MLAKLQLQFVKAKSFSYWLSLTRFSDGGSWILSAGEGRAGLCESGDWEGTGGGGVLEAFEEGGGPCRIIKHKPCIFNYNNGCHSKTMCMILETYDLRDVENTEGIMEFGHKNGIYNITWNFMKFYKFRMNKSKGLYT